MNTICTQPEVHIYRQLSISSFGTDTNKRVVGAEKRCSNKVLHFPPKKMFFQMEGCKKNKISIFGCLLIRTWDLSLVCVLCVCTKKGFRLISAAAKVRKVQKKEIVCYVGSPVRQNVGL